MTLKNICLIAIFWLISNFIGLCQSVYISPEINIKNDFSYFILSHPDGTTSLLRDKAFKLSYQTLYPDFEWSGEKNIELTGKKWRIIEAYEKGNHIAIIYMAKFENDYHINYAVYNVQAELQYEKKLYEGIRVENNEELKIQVSENNQWIGMGFYNLKEEKQLLLYNRKEDSVYYTNNIELLFENEQINIRDFEISNEGEVYLFGRTADGNTNKKRTQTMIGKFEANGNKLPTRILTYDNYLFHNGYAKFDNENKKLVIAGLYSEKSNQSAKGYVIAYLDKQLNVLNSENHAFTNELLEEWTGKSKKSGFANGELHTRNIAFAKDGSCLVFYENIKELSHRPYFSSSDPTGTYSTRWFDYYFDDIIVASFDNKGKLHWDKVMHKRQYSQDDEGLFSSFYVFRTNALLRVIFNDAISSEGTVSEYLLKPSGEHIRKSVLNTTYKNLNLRFQDAMELDAQSLLLPSENNGKLNLVKIVFE